MRFPVFFLVAAAGLAPTSGENVQVFVELSGAPGFSPYFSRPSVQAAQALPQATAQLSANAAQQETFVAGLRAKGVAFVELYRLSKLANGVALELPAETLEAVRNLPGVVRVVPIVPKKPLLATAVPLVRAPQAWQFHGATGRGVRVGIIDTGVDYLHRTFGGPGTGYSSNDTTKIGDAPYPNAKVVGGWDFAGDSYDAGSDTPSKRTPKPDPDPMDCGGHGTHVASIVAGYGETREGATFPGPFSTTTPFSSLPVAPGVAPEAQLYALRVFGCSGSTALVAQALEWAADPNNDGNPADHLDIVNLSLGSDWGGASDPDAVAATNASRVGILVVAAAGNSGDTAFISGSPASATPALSVAAAVDAGAVVGAFEVTTPSDLAGAYPASEAGFGPDLATLGDREALLASPQPGEELGCDPFSPTSAAALAGRIALINRGTCTFKRKVLNAQNAGAVGVLIVRQDDGDPFTMGNDSSITTPITIPAQMTVLSVGQRLRERLGDGVRVRLTARFRNQFVYTNPEREDTVASFSSRGPRNDLALKPDLAAPGETIFAAAHGTGAGGVSLSGTSMATPVAAGVAALVKELKPELTPWQLKAVLMNTALADLFATRKGFEPRHLASRVGAGRVDADRAVKASVVLYGADDPEAVSVSLRTVPVPGTATARLSVANLGSSAKTLTFTFTQSQENPSVRGSVVPQKLTLGSGETRDVELLVETFAPFAAPRDATQAARQGDWPRFSLPELSGHVVAKDGGEAVARVPVYGVLVPRGQALAAPALLPPGGGTLTVANPAGGTTWVVPLELAYAGPPTSSSRPAWVLFGGVGSDLGSGTDDPVFTFGVVTQEPWVSPEDVKIRVDLDLDRNGSADVRLENRRASDDSDTFVTSVCLPVTGPCTPHMPLGGLSPEGPHISVFATNVMVLTARASALRWTSGAFDFWFTTSDDAGQATVSPRYTFDPATPKVRAVPTAPGPLVWPLAFGQNVAVSATNAGGKLLLLFPENRPEWQAQVLPVASSSRPKKVFRSAGPR